LKRHYFLATPLLASLCLMPISASAYDRAGEHNSGQRIDRHDLRERNRLREERERRLRHEREARLRHEREERWLREHRAADRHEFHHGEHDRHSGWEKGQKRGWRGNNVPPGQAKKS